MMRYALILGIVLSLQVSVAQATEPSWYPGAEGNSIPAPHYSLPIHVIDGIRSTIPKAERKTWTRMRNEALEMWGLPFEVTGRKGITASNCVDFDAITMCRVDVGLWASGIGGYSPGAGGGFYAEGSLDGSFFWKPWNCRAAQAHIAHEVGHALGFYHGGTGVMSGHWRVSEEELQVARDYYIADGDNRSFE